jgi:hypothetical protein
MYSTLAGLDDVCIVFYLFMFNPFGIYILALLLSSAFTGGPEITGTSYLGAGYVSKLLDSPPTTRLLKTET